MTDTQSRSLLFREVNERIRALADRWEPEGPAGFVCECADAGCSALLDLTVADYDAVRASNGRFVVIRGHELSSGDQVAEALGRQVPQRRRTANVQPA